MTEESLHNGRVDSVKERTRREFPEKTSVVFISQRKGILDDFLLSPSEWPI
jgi:hypothetical protein